MTFPVGVTTATVTFGPYEGTGSVVFTATPLVWSATGAVILTDPLTEVLDYLGSGSIALPVDQAGFTNGSSSVRDWTYQAIIRRDGHAPDVRTFALPEAYGGTTVDLDMLASVASSAGTEVALPQVISVDGKLGVVSTDAVTAARVVDTETATGAALAATFAKVVTPETFGAIGDGVADDTAPLTAMLAAVSDGDEIRFRADATYKFTASLTLSASRVRWTGGRLQFASAVTSVSGGTPAISITGATDVEVADLQLDIITQNQQYDGIRISASTRVILRRCNVQNARWVGMGVYDVVADTSVDCQFIECVAEGCRVGLFSNGRGTTMDRCTASNRWSETQEYIDKAGVWSAPSLYYDAVIIAGTGWSVTNSRFVDNGQSGIYGGGGAREGVIASNYIADNWNKGIDLGADGSKTASNLIERVAILGNVVRDNKTGNIHGRHLDRSTIIGNVCVMTDAGSAHSGIILNGVSLYNVINANYVSQASATAPGVFVNASDGSVSNTITLNRVDATVPYTVASSTNTLITVSDGGATFVSSIKDGPVVDVSALSGFEGREVLKLVGSADNTYVQITTDKDVRILNAGGTPVGLTVGALGATGATLAGLTFLADSGTLRLPRTAVTTAGAIWYDAAAGTLKYRDAIAGVTRTITAV